MEEQRKNYIRHPNNDSVAFINFTNFRSIWEHRIYCFIEIFILDDRIEWIKGRTEKKKNEKQMCYELFIVSLLSLIYSRLGDCLNINKVSR